MRCNGLRSKPAVQRVGERKMTLHSSLVYRLQQFNGGPVGIQDLSLVVVATLRSA